MQTNRINGNNLLDVINGKFPSLPMVGLDAGGSPNHKIEGAVVQVGAYSLPGQSLNELKRAIDRCIQLLEDQEKNGHMGIEVLTDSHATIWLRAMCALSLFCNIRIGKEVNTLFRRLSELTENWHEFHVALLGLGLVPYGPLAFGRAGKGTGMSASSPGTILLPGARKRGMQADEKAVRKKLSGSDILHGVEGDGSEHPGEMTRDLYYQLLTNRPLRPTGKQYWQLSKDRQDTASGPIIKMVLSRGGFGPNLLRGTLPKLISPLVVTRHSNGHSATFVNGIPGASDIAVSCAVNYNSGTWTFDYNEAKEKFDKNGYRTIHTN